MIKKLRSHNWFWGANETGLLHKGALRSSGINMDEYKGQPVIGIANTWSELNSCNMSLRHIAEEVKLGITEAGGIAVEFPVMSLGEDLMKPTAMLYRNLLSMEVEENLRAYPVDGVILLGNCDKTIPGLLMGAVSADLPAIQLNAGPRKVGIYKNERLGSGTDLWKYWDELRKEKITNEEWEEIGKSLSCSVGSCNTMGTASTMNGLLEALGMMPLGLSTLPFDNEKRYELSREAGRRIVEMVYEDLKPSAILTPHAFDNAIAVCMALGGSTNAIIHLTALAGRLNISLYPNRFEKFGKETPCIVDVQPAGQKLIDEFDKAGGVPAVLWQLRNRLDLTIKTFSGQPLEILLDPLMFINEKIIRPLSDPVSRAPTIALIKGNLAPKGAIIKVAAASPELLVHSGRAVVFENYQDMLEKIDDPDLSVDASSVLVLKNAGPKGVPGMPEWGMIPIPKKLQQQGVKDMVRISDGRMSGTAFGTIVLHITPEAAMGNVFAIVQSGDMIRLDTPGRSIELMVNEKEIEQRKKLWKPLASKHKRGYPKLYIREVLQADEGCDFSFLKPDSAEELEFVEPVVGRS